MSLPVILFAILLLGYVFWLGYLAGAASHGPDDGRDWGPRTPQPLPPLDRGNRKQIDEDGPEDKEVVYANDRDTGRK
ncbi:MAG: hypothetical protein Hens3KO_16600 [Henriciella sp.]